MIKRCRHNLNPCFLTTQTFQDVVIAVSNFLLLLLVLQDRLSSLGLALLTNMGVLDARAFSAYDVPLVKQEAWARVDGAGEGGCLLLVWELTKTEEATAAVRASLHPQNKCCVVAVDARAVHGVSVTDPASLLAEL